jgi:hypothetical protein
MADYIYSNTSPLTFNTSGILKTYSLNQVIDSSDVTFFLTKYPDYLRIVETGPTGPTGPGGNLGSKGPKGDIGLLGPTGPSGGRDGDTGPIGPTGPAGFAQDGDLGPTGPTGNIGPTGNLGPTGSIGNNGITGPIGITGPVGSTGPIGFMGPTGDIGYTGPVGPTGPQGVNGYPGVLGPTGPTGPSGIPMGPTGPTGTSGDIGATGSTGLGLPITISITAGVNLNQYDLVYSDPNNSNRYNRATNNGNTNQADVIGMVISTSISMGNTGNIILFGNITNPSWNLTPGTRIYLGIAGGLQNTAPTSSGTYAVPVGLVVTNTTIFINILPGWEII